MALRLIIDLNVNLPKRDEVPAWAKPLFDKLDLVIAKENAIMSTLTDALDAAEAAAKANSDADDAAENLLKTIAAMVADLKNNQTDPATVERISALASALNTRASQLSTAVVANTSRRLIHFVGAQRKSDGSTPSDFLWL